MENNDLLKEHSKKLRQIASTSGLAVGTGGFKRHGVAVVTSVKYCALVVQEDTIFTEFKVNGASELANNGMSGVTFKAGAYLPGGIITDFTISSGSVIAYK